MNPTLHCEDEQRRADVRHAQLTGLDFVEVSDDQLTLNAYFLGKAPEGLVKENVRIDGGAQVRDLRVVRLRVERSGDPELDDRAEITVDRAGDCSCYTLRLVERDRHGGPGKQLLRGVDPRYGSLPIDFKSGCPSDADCGPEERCPPEVFEEPVLNYLAKDYAGFRQLILDRLSQIDPGWQERHVPDMGITLVELLAYVGDQLSYMQDAVGTEAYLETARRRISVRRHCRLVDYRLHEGCNARAWICIQADADADLDPGDLVFATSDAGSPGRATLSGDEVAAMMPASARWYAPLRWRPGPFKLRAAHSRIEIYTWGQRDCCLPAGATAATLRDPEKELSLAAGDVLMFEEVLGARTGDPDDADRARRHPVMLTRVEPAVDPLYDMPVLEVQWAPADALPFALCISSVGEDCEPLDNVSVACGNVLLVDHGSPVTETLGSVPSTVVHLPCDCEDGLGDTELVAGSFAPELSRCPVTFGEPVGRPSSAAVLTTRDPRAALAEVQLTSVRAENPEQTATWHPALDLLAALPSERAFTVEVDDEAIAHLRFGGDARAPEAGEQFTAAYRVGNGSDGNVAAEAITKIGLRSGTLAGGIQSVRNPLPATGGTDPEPLRDARLLAPSSFRLDQQRAITADDYAALARRDPQLQGAAAALEWTGSWYEADVAVDPLGSEHAAPALLDEVEDRLGPMRRLGHDLRVTGARYVAIDLALCVCVLPHYQRGHVERALRGVLGSRRLPDGSLGLFHPDRELFGGGVAIGRIVAAAVAVEGVESAWVKRLRRLGETDDSALRTGVLPLRPDEIAQLDDDRTHPERGRLELDLEGGR